MNYIDHALVKFSQPFGSMEGLTRLSPSTAIALGVSICIVALLLSRNGNKIKCLDMDGVPMKELSLGSVSKAALLFEPHQISREGEKLAHDEPYLIYDGQCREVVLHTAEHVREFLRKDAKDHFKPAGMNFGDYFSRILGQCVGALHGEQWRDVRRYFDPAYTHSAGLAMIPSFQNEVGKWLKSLQNDSLRAGVGRLIVDVPTSCKILPLRVIPQSFYGEAFDDDAYEKLVRIGQTQKQALKYAVMGWWQKYRWFNMLPTPSRRVLDQYHRDWKAFNLEILETARRKGLAAPADHIYKGVQPDGAMTVDQYLQTIDEMIFTNIDITSSVLAFMLSLLAQHPDFQQRLYDEIMAQRTEKGLDMKVYMARQDSLLHYLCLETLRLNPATLFSVPECTSIDKVIGRYKVPARTPVIIDVRRLNTNALTWGPDGGQFRPERFATLSSNHYRYGFMRFGVASSKCLGKHMADTLMKVAMATILEQYRIDEVEKGIGVKEGDLAFIKRK
ncbi:cytochrome P450 [Aspergillus bertholletiae]|uniref:Cytochrome P450 n=1 Tax=Aspergillus bertholletiae TaxID=1226010 RepID=A0A5N7BNU3_9EURO|nr:cytochrome P450 [Aspergillus bertholletiae]